MPHYSDKDTILDPDKITVPLVGISYDDFMSLEEPHAHRSAQLIYVSKGSFKLDIAHKQFLVPSSNAIWIPSFMEHSAFSTTKIHYRSLYFDVDYFTTLPKDMQVISVSPLLKALVEKACLFSLDYSQNSPESRLGTVIVDEISGAETQPYYLPLSHHASISAILAYVLEHLDETHTATEIAKNFAMSDKTMSRLFKRETGMCFGQWFLQVKLMKAIELLSADASTTTTAQSLGYSNDSAFIAMFKRLAGKTPSAFKSSVIS